MRRALANREMVTEPAVMVSWIILPCADFHFRDNLRKNLRLNRSVGGQSEMTFWSYFGPAAPLWSDSVTPLLGMGAWGVHLQLYHGWHDHGFQRP